MDITKKTTSVLDLDGTVVPEHSWALLVVAATSLAFAFHFPLPVACIVVVCLFIPVRPLQNVAPPVFVNTARPWPFVSPVTLWALGVPFPRLFPRLLGQARLQDHQHAAHPGPCQVRRSIVGGVVRERKRRRSPPLKKQATRSSKPIIANHSFFGQNVARYFFLLL